MHPILFGNQTLVTEDDSDFFISKNDAPFFAVRSFNGITIYLPNSKSTEDGFTVAIHNQTSGGGFYIDAAESSGDKVDNQNLPFHVQQPGQLYIFKLDKPAKLWRPLLGYYPGNCN